MTSRVHFCYIKFCPSDNYFKYCPLLVHTKRVYTVFELCPEHVCEMKIIKLPNVVMKHPHEMLCLLLIILGNFVDVFLRVQ